MFRIRQQQQRTLGDQGFIGRLEELLAEDFYGRTPTPEVFLPRRAGCCRSPRVPGNATS